MSRKLYFVVDFSAADKLLEEKAGLDMLARTELLAPHAFFARKCPDLLDWVHVYATWPIRRMRKAIHFRRKNRRES